MAIAQGQYSGTAGSSPDAPEVSRWRPYVVIAGLVTSFTLVTLLGSLLLSVLHLPQDIIRWVAMGVLVIIGIGLISPKFEFLIERPLAFLPKRNVDTRRNGFGVGLALGAVFVPCAGPVLAAIIVAGSTGQIGVGTVLLTVSFAIGVAIPLLFFALAGRGLSERISAFRRHERGLRIAAGIAMIALAFGLAFNLPAQLQRLVPDYTNGIQQSLTDSDTARKALDLGGLVNDENRELDQCTDGAADARVLRHRAVHQGHRKLAQHRRRRWGEPRRSPRQGGAHRLLGVLVHQLPAFYPARRCVGQGVQGPGA